MNPSGTGCVKYCGNTLLTEPILNPEKCVSFRKAHPVSRPLGKEGYTLNCKRTWACKCGLALALAVWNGPLASGQTDQAVTDSAGLPRSGIYPVPVVFFTPETGLAGGAAAVSLFRAPLDARASSLSGDAIYTAKQQMIAELGCDLYLNQGKYRLQANLSFKKFPNKFYGIGNNTAGTSEESYTPQLFEASFRMGMNLFSRFHAGPLLRVETASMKESVPTGELARGALPGSKGGTAVGAGAVVNWDSRDNTFAAETGSLVQLTAMAYRKEFGGDYNFTFMQFDARRFFKTAPGQALAVQAVVQSVRGSVPFQSFTTFGGANCLRGYYEGRCRDNDGAALQAEYRAHIWWRIGLVGFAGIAQVADRIDRMALDRFWCAAGLGVRYEWNLQERVNLRLDYGIGNNSSGMYVTVNEAI